MGTSQASAKQASLAPWMSEAAELVRTLDLRTIAFPDGSLHVETVDDHIIQSTIKRIRLNIGALSNETLHALHTRVADELRTRE